MADYTAIANATIEPNAPLISATLFALRDNPAAIAEGASGAPRIVNGAVVNSTLGAEKFQSGNDERDWVLARCAAADAGAVGTYAFLSRAGENPTTAFGGTESGSNLRPSNASGGASGPAQSGTWRCMGYQGQLAAGNDQEDTTLWLRVS